MNEQMQQLGFEDIDASMVAPRAESLPPMGDKSLSFHSCVLRGVVFRETPKGGHSSALHQDGSPVSVSANMRLVNQHLAEVRLYTSVRDSANGRWEMRVTYSAFIRSGEHVGTREFANAVSRAGVRWTFPYVRELVSGLSQKGIFGAINLDPILDVSPIASEEEVSRLIEEVESARRPESESEALGAPAPRRNPSGKKPSVGKRPRSN